MPKNGVYILFFFFFSTGKLYAQTLNWANVFSIGNGGANSSGINIADMKADNEGNIIVVGEYGLNDSLNGVLLPKFNYNYIERYVSFLAKFDTSGHLLWMDTTMGIYFIEHIEISKKGDYFFSGGSGSFLSSPFPSPNTPAPVNGGFIGKCDRNGKMYWVRRYNNYNYIPGYSSDGGDIPYFQVDTNENVYFMLIPIAPGSMVIDTTKYQNSIYLVKFDSIGKLSWINQVVESSENIAIDGLGNTYCLTKYNTAYKYRFNSPTVINKYDLKGKLVNHLIFDATDSNVSLVYIITDRYNNVYIEMNSVKDFILNGHRYPNNNFGIYLFKLDTGLNVIWSLFCGYAGGPISINKKTDYLYMTGYGYKSQINIGGQSTHNAPNDTLDPGNAYFVKMDLNGKVFWIKNTTYSLLAFNLPIIIEDVCNNFFISCELREIHFDGLNIGSPNYNYEGSVIAKFSSDSLAFVNQNATCDLSLKNISNPVFTQFQWYAKDVGDTSIGKLISTSKDLNYEFPHKHTYIITMLAIKAGGCTNTVQDTFTVPGSPVAGFSAIDTQGCQYVQFQFSDTSHADTINTTIGQSWHWDFGDQSAPLSYSQAKHPVVSHVYTQNGTYTVKLVYSNGLCTDTFVSQKKVVIIPAPKPGFLVSDTIGCAPLGVNVTDGSVGSVDKWVYTIGPASAKATAGKRDSLLSPSFSYTFSVPGKYIIHQYLTGPTGCVTEDSVLVNVTPVFDGSERADMFYVSVDTGNAIEANWYAFPGAFNYALYRYADNDSANTVLLTQTDRTSFMDINADPVHHSYTYYIVAQDGCGHFTSHGRIGKTIKLSGFENSNLLPQLAWTAYKDWPGWPNSYEVLRQDPGGAYKNAGSANDTSYVDTALTARDVYGECYCVRTLWNDTAPVSYSNVFCFGNTPQIYIPNIFTPDANSLNDVFAPVFTGIKSYSMTIINRWGEKVYTLSASPSSPSPPGEGRGEVGWDGSFKGAISPNGIYIYFIKAEDFNGNTITRKGMIMLQQ